VLWPGDQTLGTKKQERAEKETIELLCKSIVGHVIQTQQRIVNGKKKNVESTKL